jgi:hypothetical protein
MENNERCKKFYWDRRNAGLCVRCGEPALPNRILCEVHRKRSEDLTQSRKEKIATYKKSIRSIENERKKSPQYKAKRNAYRRSKKRTDPAWAMADRLRKRIGRAMRDHAKIRKNGRTHQLLGCTIPELMAHIEKQFLPSMTWENRDKWHLDHVRPCKSFNLADPEQQKICFNYQNLQPLWALDNISKHAKWEEEKVA